MRIAPKPKPGQEISLESLLDNGEKNTSDLKPKLGEIKESEDHYSMFNVLTSNGYFDIDMMKTVNEEVTQEKFIEIPWGADGRPWRPLSADQFYEIAQFLNQMAGIQDHPQNQLFRKAREFLRIVWGEGLSLNTYVRYATPKDEIVHFPGTVIKTTRKSVVKYVPALGWATKTNMAIDIFGSTDWETLNQLWIDYHSQSYQIHRIECDEPNNFGTYGVNINRSTIDIRHDLKAKTRTILVAAKKVEA